MILKDLPSQRWKHSTNNLHNIFSVVIENNCRVKLQCFLKHNNLISKLAKQYNNTYQYYHSIEFSKNEKELKQHSKLKAQLIFTKTFNFLGQILISTQVYSIHVFSSQIFRPSDAFLQIYFSRLNGHIFQIFANLFIYCAILTCL